MCRRCFEGNQRSLPDPAPPYETIPVIGDYVVLGFQGWECVVMQVAHYRLPRASIAPRLQYTINIYSLISGRA